MTPNWAAREAALENPAQSGGLCVLRREGTEPPFSSPLEQGKAQRATFCLCRLPAWPFVSAFQRPNSTAAPLGQSFWAALAACGGHQKNLISSFDPAAPNTLPTFAVAIQGMSSTNGPRPTGKAFTATTASPLIFIQAEGGYSGIE